MSELTDSQIDAIKTDVDPWLEAIEGDSDYFKIKRHIVDLQTRIAAAEADAERYRWLRDGGNDDIGVVIGFDCIDVGSTAVVGTYGEGLDGEHLDSAIDAARGGAGE